MRRKSGQGKGRQDVSRRKTHPLELKLKVLQELNAGTGVGDVCRAFGLAHTTVALWRQAYAKGGYEALFPRKPGKTPAANKADDSRREAVLALKKAHPEYGTRRIRDVLKRFEAIGISESEVRRMLHEAGLMEAEAKTPREEPLPRRFERAGPNQLWQSDIFTFLLRRHERVYLCAFMDDHSRFITGWCLERHQKGAIATSALERGIAKWGAPKEVLTDNGRQYTAWRGRDRIRADAEAAGDRAPQGAAAAPADAGEDRALLEDAVGRVSLPDGVCELRGPEPAPGAVYRGIQLPAAAPGAGGALACGPLFPRRATRARDGRAAGAAQRDAAGAAAAGAEAILSGGQAGRPRREHRRGPGRPSGAGGK